MINITAAIAEGPAINGMANGTTKGSPSGVLVKISSEPEKIIFKEIKNNTTPPAAPNEDSDICNNCKIY